jgi:peptide/nickel transport system permease protein|tara:strand:- start:192 stop:1112 length:921 start_codon:yes stop_codon:yes gene_type:complete
MLTFLRRRLFQGLISILIVLSIAFVVLNLSGDPIRMMLPPTASQEDVEAMRKSYGFDQPLIYRYFTFLNQIAHLDFGKSVQTRRPALSMVLARLPATILLSFSALFLAALFGIPLGILAAVKRGKIVDTLAVLLSMVGQSTPVFWIALILIYLFGVIFPVLPPSGYGTAEHLILPATSLSLFLLAGITRVTRTSLLEVLNMPFITTARSKGLKEHVVILKHAFLNAVIPVVTQLALQMRFVIGGSVVVEAIFGWPGLGQLLAQAAFARDYPVVITSTFFISLFIILLNIALDCFYSAINPRIKLWE